MTAKEIKQRIDYLEKRKEPYMATLEKIAEYLLPSRELLFKYRESRNTKDKNGGYNVFDGSPISAINMMVDGMYAHICPSNLAWFKMRLPDERLNKMRSVKEWMERADWHILMALERSNFYHEITKVLLDGIGLGTAYMYPFENSRTGRIVFRTFHPYQCYISSDEAGDDDTFARKYKMTARNLKAKFGLDKLPKEIQNIFDSEKGGDPYEEYDINVLIVPGYDDSEFFPIKKDFEYTAYYVLDCDDDFIETGGFNDFPVVTWKYRQDSEEEYGRGVGHDALYDVLGINQMSRTMQDAANRSADPPALVPVELKGRFKNQPHGVTYYEDPGRLPFPYNTGINFPIGVHEYDRKRDIVERHFHMDFWLALSREQGRRTATEIIEMQGEKIALLSANIGRFEGALDRILSRVLQIEISSGRLDPPPDIVYQSGQELSVDFLGPLSQALRRLFKGSGITRALSQIIPIFEMDNSVIDHINTGEMVRELLDANGMPVKLMNTKKKVKEIRQQKQAIMQQQQAMEAAKSMNGLPIEQTGEPGSMLEKMTEEAEGVV